MRQSNHLTNIYQNIIRVAQLMGAPVCSIPGERRRRDCGWWGRSPIMSTKQPINPTSGARVQLIGAPKQFAAPIFNIRK